MKFKRLFNKKMEIKDVITIVVTLLVFILMLIFSFWSFYTFKENQVKLRESHLKQYVNERKSAIDEYFTYNFKILKYLATFSEIYTMDWDKQYNFLKSTQENLNFEHFIIIDSDGKGYYTSTNEIKDQSNEEFFYDVIENETFLTDPFIEEDENRAITTLSVSIYNNGEKVGALCGVINLSEIYKRFEDDIVGNNGLSFLINNKGTYIAHKNKNYIFNKNNFFDDIDETITDIKFLREDIENNNTNLQKIILNNKEYYAVFSTLSTKNWELVFALPRSEFLLGLTNFTTYQIGVISFVVILIILLRRVVFQSVKNHKLAYNDSLTHINNRAAIDSILKGLENNYKSKITIITFDLNDFKYVNDTYGHHIGDELLCVFSNILDATLGRIGFVGRMGGDEFITILKDKDILEFKYKLKEIDKLVYEYNKNNTYKIKISYGYSIREIGDNTSLNNIYKEADKNMYEFKNKNKDYKRFKI